LDAFEKGIIPAVVKHVPANCTVAELYSGIGVIGLNVASKSLAVYCSDSNEFVDDVFDSCVDSLPEQHRDKAFYENLPADEAVAAGQCEDADVMIVDPPRKGLDAGVKQLLLGKHESQQALSKNDNF
jgi:tRNA/tmRNA/rRNA uracil-C5-methylase (TrmA/RlmC/RlmD family)